MDHNTWSFVAVGQAGQPKRAEDRKTVRKMAMKAFRRRERISRIKAFAAECALPGELTTSSSTSALPTQVVHVPREAPEEPLQEARDVPPLVTLTALPMIPRSLGSPSGFSYGDDSGVAYIFEYYISVIIPIMLPVQSQSGQASLRNYWRSNLLRDPLVLQAAISHAAVHMDITHQREPGRLAVKHTKHALCLLEERLASQDFAIDNEVIEAVGLLATISNITGDLSESQIHMSALEQIVWLRGGRDKLGPNQITTTLLSWSNTTSARICRSRPRLALDSKASTGPGISSEKAKLHRKEEVFGLCDTLRKLTSLKNTIDTNPSATLSDIIDFDTQRNASEERLLCLQHTFLALPDLDFIEQFLATCCIAAALYMSLAFRNFRPDFPILRTLKYDLMSAIVKTEDAYGSLKAIPDSDTPYAEVLFWMLFIGGSLAVDAEEKTWFAHRISQVLPWTEVASWHDAEACLMRTLWVDKLHNEACRSLWVEVQDILGLKPEVE